MELGAGKSKSLKRQGGLHRALTNQKNRECVKRVAKLMDDYRPDAVILPESDDPKRCRRIRNLISQITKKARAKGIEIITVTREQLQKRFALHDAMTKYEIAKLIAEWYPPLKPKLPRLRKSWESEDERMGVFKAISQNIGLLC